ncbi:MAG: pseudoazurin [Pseudomonadota bacterium]
MKFTSMKTSLLAITAAFAVSACGGSDSGDAASEAVKKVEAAANAAGETANEAAKVAGDTANKVASATGEAATNAGASVREAAANAKDAMGDAGDKAKDAMTDAGNKAKDQMAAAGDAAKEKATNIGAGAAAAAGGAVAAAGNAAQNVGDKAVQAANNAAGNAAEVVKTAASNAQDAVAGGGTVHEIKMLNAHPDNRAQTMVFVPNILKIAPGDTVKFLPSDPGHNTQSTKGMIPAGTEGWKSKAGEEFEVTLTEPGIYGYNCLPHNAAGMVGLIIVEGDGMTANLEDAKSARQIGLAKRRWSEIWSEVEAENLL